MVIITLPEILRERLGTEAAQALVDLRNRSARETRDDVITIVGERFERRLGEEIGKVHEEIAKVREELAKVPGQITAAKVDLLRWMLLFWATQLLAILGLLWRS